MILSNIRDPRFITIRRGGLMDDETHHLLALWAAGGHAMAAARVLKGAAAYAIKAVRASVGEERSIEAGVIEREWQRSVLPDRIRELVLDDQRFRNSLCWFVFDPLSR